MTTATAPTVARAVLEDRWASVMDWDRTGGSASPVYEELTDGLFGLTNVLIGVEPGTDTNGVVTDRLLDEIRDILIARAQAAGLIRVERTD